MKKQEKDTYQEILKKLEQIAFLKTTPFCYGCYIKAPTGVCLNCGTDDLMRELKGFGVEYGTEWVYEQLLKEALTPVDTEEIFINMVEDCYEDAKIGWITVDTVTAIKNLDSVSWRLAQDDYIESLVSDEELITFDEKNYFWKYDVLEFIENQNKVAS